ncbi:histidinol phosphate phosphatase H [Trametopsis cervina]|nr:histidinol phosphate phosphatase H [Trametopsis cervina]
MPHSHHSHSGQFCKHAKGTLEEVVQEAIKQGFESYGLTEHVPRYRVVDLYPEEEGLQLHELEHSFNTFLTEAHRLKTKYVDQINLLVGLETEYISTLDLDRMEMILSQNEGRIEYVVGSVHHVNELPIDFDEATYEQALASFATSDVSSEHEQMDAYLSSYFDAQYRMMNRIKPEVIGHIDLCRLYRPSLRFADYPAAYERLRRNVQFAVEYGAVFELNAAAFRKGWSEAYPGEDVIKIIRDYGGRFVLSDDSHGPHAVGLNYTRLAEYVRRVGIEELWLIEQANSLNPSGRLSRCKKLEGSWWEHRFWRNQH